MRLNAKFVSFILVIVCLWEIYHIIDQSITIDHYKKQLQLTQSQIDIMVLTVNHFKNHFPKSQTQEFLKNNSLNFFLKDENTIVADNIIFIYHADELSKISAQ